MCTSSSFWYDGGVAWTVGAWTTERNEKKKGIQWHFNVEKARAKLKALYPIKK
jgi:hypothetical protein